MEVVIKGSTHKLPIFLPDATHATVKNLNTKLLPLLGTRGVVVNTYHLLTDKIVSLVHESGGIKAFMGFDGLVITDSGGFQAMSLVRRNPKLGKIGDEGVFFKNPISGDNLLLTPELCIETQLQLGSDIVMLLDDCTDPTEPEKEQEKSVKRTVSWALRAKNHFKKLTKHLDDKEKPKLFGIAQGGNSRDLRQECARELINIGFDGYAYGGWPVLNHVLLEDILRFTAQLMPNGLPKYAMGVGKPNDICVCSAMGYNMFDCVIPTRDARHGRLYLLNQGAVISINIGNTKYANNKNPIDTNCGCPTCINYPTQLLHYFYKIGEPIYQQLATAHNLFVYNELVKLL